MQTSLVLNKEVFNDGFFEYFRRSFIERENIQHSFSTGFQTIVKLSFADFYSRIEKVFGREILSTDSTTEMWTHIELSPNSVGGNKLLFSVYIPTNITKELDNSDFGLCGTREDVIEAQTRFLNEFPVQACASLVWKYKVGDQVESANVGLSARTTLHDEFYPFLNMPVADFMDDYFNSSQNVLILLGPPGTGKTSLIRELIYRHNLSVALTHDLELMKEDRLFADYLMSNHNALILEDADLLLADRITDDNKLMSKFLNLSEGLVNSTKKKMIFTANIDVSAVDTALTRPGRCYAAVNFRPLTHDEALAACNVIGKDIPGDAGEFNLTQIFNSGRMITKPKFGFAR